MTQTKPRSPAQAKPAPRFEDFNIHSILTKADDVRRANSERCLESLGLEAGASTIVSNARQVPRGLLELEAGRLNAALTTTTQVADLIASVLGPAVLPSLEQGEIMPRLAQVQAGRAALAVPRVTSTVSTGTPVEGANAIVSADPAALAIDSIPADRKRLQSTVFYTPEAEASTGAELFSAVLAAAVLAQIDNLAESLVWSGTGLDGQPLGLEAQLTDAQSIAYTAGGLTLENVWGAIAAMNSAKLPRNRRFLVASADMSNTLATGYNLHDQRGAVPQLFNLPIVHSTRPVEDGLNGRLWAISGASIQPTFFGNIEMVLNQQPGESHRRAGWLQQWSLLYRQPTPFRTVRVF